MLVLVRRMLKKTRVLCTLLLVFCFRQTGVESERFLKQPTLIEARPLSLSAIYLSWKGPINHPGGLIYRIYLKKESRTFKRHKDLSGSSFSCVVDGLEANVRYDVCVRVVDKLYQTTTSSCDDVAVITTPAQLGHVSKTDRKYLTKGGFYRGARHYWPFDYETQLRDVKYSRDGRQKGTLTEVSITGKPRGYLSINGSGWVKLGKFLKDCVCDVHHCTANGVSIGLWLKLSTFDNETKVLVGSDKSGIWNATGIVIYQTSRALNGSVSKGRYINTAVFMNHQKWKCHFAVEPGHWFYLTVTWSNRLGLLMFKNGELMSEQKQPKSRPRVFKYRGVKCAVALSPPSASGETLNAFYDDLVIWTYELNRTLMHRVYRNAIDPPKIEDCRTSDGVSAEIYINDKDHIYDIKGDYRISWQRKGGNDRGENFTKNLSYHIKGLIRSSEYIVEVQRRVFLPQTSKTVLSKSSRITCNIQLNVPTRPKAFTVRETAAEYFNLQWKPPDNVYGSTYIGYKISYRVDDFLKRKWSFTFRADVNSTYLTNLHAFTDYVIKLACQNENGIGKAVVLRATTAEGVPTPPRRLRVKLKREIIVIKWREPKEMKGLVDYRLFALINGTLRTICRGCGESYKLENVDQNTKYTFWVVAYNINNDPRFESQPSKKQNITTPSFTPSSPNNLVVNFTQSGIEARWEASSVPRGRVQYKLFGLVNGSKHETFCNECGLKYLIKDVARYTVYTLWAVAYNVHKDYESPPSMNVTIDTSLYVPIMPNALTVKPSLEGIVISWNKSQVRHGSIRYQLMGRENGVNKVFCVHCGLKYLINKTERNTNYSFWVVAYNIQNGYQSPPSSIVHYHTSRMRPPSPECILAPEVRDSSATITWNRPGGVNEDEIVGYKVILYDAFSIVDIKTTDSLRLEFNNLTQFSKFYVTVQALTRSGSGLPSQQLTIHTKDKDECATNEMPCSKNAMCINSAGSYFCSCLSGYVGDGNICEALPSGITEADFCPEEVERNITWKETYNGQTDKNLCPIGTIGISTRTCLKRNESKSYWSDPDLSNCVSDWMTAVDDKLADRTLNGTKVGDFFLNLLEKNHDRGLYGGDIIKSVDVIDLLYNKSKHNELDQQKSNHKVAEPFLVNLINITEKIISPETIRVWNDIPKKRRTEQSIRIMNSLDSAVLKSANIVNFSSIQNEHIDVRYGRVSTFKLRNNMSSSEEHLNEIDSIKLPEQEEKGNKMEDQSVAVIKYDTIAEVLSVGDKELNDKDVVNSAVLSISVNPPLSTPFYKPLEFTLSNQKDGQFDKHKCAFFNTSRYPGFWSTSGCVVFHVTNKFTVCHCYHMTSFSVLMQVKPAEISYSDELILDWITRIGLCISLAALGLAFLTFVFLPRPCGHRSGSRCFKLCDQGYRPTYLKKVRTSIHANLILSLALGEALFLWGIDKTENKTTCYAVAVALHYLFLVAFHWMAAEGVILYLVLVKVFQRKSANKDKRMFMIICWGSPAAIVCIALAVGHEYYLHEKCCWLSVTRGIIWGFVGPALAIILLNIFFLCCTFHVMGKRQRWDKTDKNMMNKIRYWAKGAAIITCLLGVTWVFGVFYLNSDSVIFAYIFNICNVFQGLFIFVFHCLLDEKIRQQYSQVLCAVANVDSRSPTVSTGTGKKEQRRGTFNSWLWSVAPMKLQDSKSESCPTVAENTLKRVNSSTHSLSPYIDRRLMEIKQHNDTRPRGMSSIYHDSDENMDNIPDNILTVKHGSKNNSGKLYYQDEDTTGGVFEEQWMSATSRGNSQEFLEVPQETCEDCLYEIKQWEEQQEISRKTSSSHEQELKRLKEPCCRLLESENGCSDEDVNDETNIDKELCQKCTTDEEDQHEKLLTNESDKNTEHSEQCTSYTSIVPRVILSGVSKSKIATAPKCYQMVKVTDVHGVEISSASGKKLPCPMSV